MRVMQISSFSLLALIVASGVGCEAMGLKKAEYNPKINPADFQAKVDNPYYPLVPGTVLKYSEKTEGETLENIITVTSDTKMIMGVKCVVVHDVVMANGKVKEDTNDWLAQHKDGTVWYFGEDTKEFKAGGKVSTEGSWEGGVKGAQPGILMPANPKPGEPYRQEYGRGVAEDMGQVVELRMAVTVPYGTFEDCVKTKDWSMLEAGHEFKWYAKGIGFVRSESSSKEVSELVSFTHP